MTKELRILILEDEPADAVLIKHELRRGGLEFHSKRVDNQHDFMSEMRRHPPDLILSDHGLPGFDGFTALALARGRRPGVPFIFVSGSRNLQAVIETLKQGADAYVFKDRLATSLVPAVRRVLRDNRGRRRRGRRGMTAPKRGVELDSLLGKLRSFSGLLLVGITWGLEGLLWK
ncbi:MAG: response regulator [Verrucomicrobia bacterium]|nr:response regulator [Verrucomicrobiota bacterium]